MITSTTNHPSGCLKKDAKSATINSQEVLGFMHDHHNNTYHSSLYRHQLQTRQQHNRSAAKNHLITSSHSCGSPSRSPLSQSAADPTRPHSTPSCYSHSNKYYYDGDGPTDAHCINHSVDFSSLCEAMDDSYHTNSRRRPPVTTAADGDGHDSFDTMLSYLRKNDELAQQMDEIEQLENLSFLRVMYLGIASAEEKHLFLKKLSDGLSESLFRQTSALPPLPSKTKSTSSSTTATATNNSALGDDNTNNVPLGYGFRERKHHLLPLHLFLAGSALDDHYYDDHAAMFEDNGVSIVEADFSTDNNVTDPRIHNPDLILHYIYTQYQQYFSPSTLSSIINPSPQWENQRFDGHVFSEGAPNGIDLCVYFYHDAQKMTDVTKDMDILWKINALGIPVLPIMSMSNQTTISPLLSPSLTANEPSSPANGKTTQRYHHPSKSFDDDDELHTEEEDNDDDDDIYGSPTYVKQRPIDVRRNELAYIFSQWRIKMMDISNLDIIGQPSFQQKGNTRISSTQEDLVIERRLGRAWAISSMTPSTPYHILTLFQFMAMDRWAVSKLLKTIQDRADERCYGGAGGGGGDLIPTTTSNDDDTQLGRSFMASPVRTTTNPRQQQQSIPPSHAMDALQPVTTTTFHQDKNQSLTQQYDYTTGHEPSQQQKQKFITIHIWLLYALPLLVLLGYGIWIALTGLIGGIVTAVTQLQQSSSTWHASLIMVSHSSGKSMTLMVNVYDGQHQPRWAPEPPLIWTNLPLSLTSVGLYSPTSKEISTTTTASPNINVAPLLNKTQSLEGQYFYSILLPSCSLLDPDLNYIVQVKPSATLSSTSTIQGSPLQLPKYVLCDPLDNHQDQALVSSSTYAMESGDLMDAQETRHLLEAWYHFRQYSRFYLMNSLKIVELIFTEGKEKN